MLLFCSPPPANSSVHAHPSVCRCIPSISILSILSDQTEMNFSTSSFLSSTFFFSNYMYCFVLIYSFCFLFSWSYDIDYAFLTVLTVYFPHWLSFCSWEYCLKDVDFYVRVDIFHLVWSRLSFISSFTTWIPNYTLFFSMHCYYIHCRPNCKPAFHNSMQCSNYNIFLYIQS